MKTDVEYRMFFGMVTNAAATLNIVPLEDMLRTVETADSFGPLLDPTSYMHGAKNLPAQREVLEAAIRFVAAVKKHTLSPEPRP